MDDTSSVLDLPGFRFHPTEEELLDYYLKNVVYGKNSRVDVIGHLNIYRHDPWDLPGLSTIGEREWYFFVPRDRKHGSAGRPNRTTATGFWKATGSDRKIFSLSDTKRIIGLKKTLVFYQGRAPRGTKTDWVMNEYRLPDSCPLPKDIVLCKIYRKATPLKVLEQRAAMEEEIKAVHLFEPSPSSSLDTTSYSFQEDQVSVAPEPLHMVLKEEVEEDVVMVHNSNSQAMKGKGLSLQLPMGKDKISELMVPKLSMDWNLDNFLLSSPWLQNLTPYADILNF